MHIADIRQVDSMDADSAVGDITPSSVKQKLLLTNETTNLTDA
jgi:hypothetical protein